MKKLIFVLCLISIFVNGQSLYTGHYGKSKRTLTLKINQDSSIILIRNIGSTSYDGGYDEYNGVIKRINDTLFHVNSRLSFSQSKCRAIGDSLIYIGIDSTLRKSITEIKLEYSNKEIKKYPINGRSDIIIPINRKIFNTNLDKNFFYLSVGYRNPINNNEVKTLYKIKEEYCLEIYTENAINFDLVIKNNRVRAIGKSSIGNFTLKKNLDTTN